MHTKTITKPFIKWAGGKQAVAPNLIRLFPISFGTYYEPFVGGGSILYKLNTANAVINDHNSWLIDTYIAIRDDWKKVVKQINKLENTKEEYLRIRKINPYKVNKWIRAAHFIYLNKTGFRGLFRVNKNGGFNVPYGNYDRRYYDPENLETVSNFLKKVQIRKGDFELSIYDVKKDDFVYFDPPYYKLGGYSDFNRYTSQQFGASDHIRLASLCREIDLNGIKWAVSNSNTPFIRNLYKGYNVNYISNRREINLKSTNRNVKELLITNYKNPI